MFSVHMTYAFLSEPVSLPRSRLLLLLLEAFPFLQFELAEDALLHAPLVQQRIQVPRLLKVRLVGVCAGCGEYEVEAALALELGFGLPQQDFLLLRDYVAIDAVQIRCRWQRARHVHGGQVSGDSAEVWVPRARVMCVFLFTPALLQEQSLVDTVGAALVANSAGCGLGFASVLAAQE